MPSDGSRGQVKRSAAEVYESFFLPALFDQFVVPMADALRVAPGQRALDVACGTGVLTRELSRRVGRTGSVVGADINDGMLAVARRAVPGVEWRKCAAEQLEFDDGSIDAVACQFGLMFFTDRRLAVQEMARVLRPGGRLAVAVWDGLDTTPGYDAMVDLLQRLFGKVAADALRAPFLLGDRSLLETYFAGAPLHDLRVATQDGTARFESIEAWVRINIKGWTLADMIDEAQYQELLNASEKEFRRFVQADGTVVFAAPAHIVSAERD